MSKSTNYPPGTFLEVDHPNGGRKVVLVCRDGVTYWDALDVASVKPRMIDPEQNPVDLGNLVQYANREGLHVALAMAVAWLQAKQDKRVADPLFFARMLWHLAQKGALEPDDAALDEACQAAQNQARSARIIQKYS